MKRDEGRGLFDKPLPEWAKSKAPPLPKETLDELASLRREVGIARSGDRAQRVAPLWWPAALAAVRVYAANHETFLAEDVRVSLAAPEGVDKRAWGSIMRAACQDGIVEHAGYAPANSSNRGPKTLWRSKVLREQ